VRWTLIALALVILGCGTKVLELAPPPDGATVPPFPTKFCLQNHDTNGVTCMQCYNEWGAPVGGCAAVNTAPCFTKQTPTFERCLFCGGDQRGCLKCEPIPLTQSCRHCMWTDGIDKGTGCTQCFDAAGKPSSDDCDELRPELPHTQP
jgi:hypothetical protein